MNGRKYDWRGDNWVVITRAMALITRCTDSDAHHWLAVAHRHLGLLLLTQHLILAPKLFNLLVLLLDLTQKLVFTTEFLNLILLSRCLMMVYLVHATNRCFLIIKWARVPPFLVLFFDTVHLCLCIFFDTFV